MGILEQYFIRSCEVLRIIIYYEYPAQSIEALSAIQQKKKSILTASLSFTSGEFTEADG